MQKFLVLVTVLSAISKLTEGYNVRNPTLSKANDKNLSHRVCHYCTSDPSREQDDAMNLLNFFIKQLKGFIIETQFRYAQFETHTRGLKQFLETIRIHVETLDPYNSHIMKQLLFAERMFGAMVMATGNANKFNYWGTTDHYLVISMIELGVALFALCDSNGIFDSSHQLNIQKLYLFEAPIHQWNREFSQLKSYSAEAFELFENERNKAEHMVYMLKGWIKKHK